MVDDNHSSRPGITDGLERPTRKPRTGRPFRLRREAPPIASLFGLAPCGVLPATHLTMSAVRSYRTFSPLPAFALRASCFGLRRGRPVSNRACHAVTRGSKSRERRRAVCFLCHCPSGCPDRELPGALPCGVRTFLPPSRSAPQNVALRRQALSTRLAAPKLEAEKPRAKAGGYLVRCDELRS